MYNHVIKCTVHSCFCLICQPIEAAWCFIVTNGVVLPEVQQVPVAVCWQHHYSWPSAEDKNHHCGVLGRCRTIITNYTNYAFAVECCRRMYLHIQYGPTRATFLNVNVIVINAWVISGQWRCVWHWFLPWVVWCPSWQDSPWPVPFRLSALGTV